MAASPSRTDAQFLPAPEAESQLSSLVYGSFNFSDLKISGLVNFPSYLMLLLMNADISQEVQGAMENMLKMINEIDQNSAQVMEEIEKCKDSALERKRILEEEKERFQKAAYTVLDMLNNRD
ncbi:hypothetical protein CJ030_MR8G021828 [Morella rubra]|uniref:Polyamine-modulated factor 1-binding protein 1 n=1 Tax=Morella rubra TaxID=262757 RepID=A0A6A1UZL1_9ROSI|nr:hypothetical protein CJ030_MR8G021828 [Morella rubra]